MVVLDILGVEKKFEPEANKVPPVGESYQSTTYPAGGVALINTEPVPHLD